MSLPPHLVIERAHEAIRPYLGTVDPGRSAARAAVKAIAFWLGLKGEEAAASLLREGLDAPR